MDLVELLQQLNKIHEEHGNVPALYVDAFDRSEGLVCKAVFDNSEDPDGVIVFDLEDM